MSRADGLAARDELAEIRGRVTRLRGALAKLDFPALLVSAQANVRYLTRFTGSSGYLLVTPEEVALYTDGRYSTQARQQTDSVEIIITQRNPLTSIVKDVTRRRIRRLAFEKNRLSFETYEYLRGALPRRRLEAVSGLVESLRAIKSPGEIERIRRSAALNSEAFDRACSRARPHWTEARLAAEIEYQVRGLGAEKCAFDTIVAAGPRSALPHAEPSREPLARNSLIVIDQGAILDGYTSDMTRMACLGRLSNRERRLFEAVREAQGAAVDAVKAGVQARTVDREARRVLRKFKLAEAFKHSTGHGLGLEIHEQPRIGPDERLRLRAGMVITIEPGAYVEGLGGVRIEDVVAITRNGCEVLTPTPRQLRHL